MKLSEATKNQILELQSLYPEKRSALIPALHLAQKERGYLPPCLQKEVAFLFGITPNEVQSVVTFYDMFHEEPVGKHLIHLCKNVSCMLRGSDEIMERLKKELGVEAHGTTKDGEFTLIPSECLGACDRAPMMILDDQVIGPLSEAELPKHLSEAKKRGSHHG